MFFEQFFFILYIPYSLAGYSKVLQGVKHGTYMSEFCTKMEYCPEGTHVMCMYNPEVNSGMGPSCHSSVRLTVSEQLKEEILSVTNSIRQTIVKGDETGLNGVKLPKGFGMWRLNWDEDLAIFAQVLANQCVLKHDMCRATQKFPDPGQTVGVMRFTYPSWEPIKNIPTSLIDKPLKGFSDDLVEYAVLNIIKKWYKQKKNVTPDHIHALKWNMIIGSYEGTLYLQMIYGFTTHMGCGVSAFTDYIFNVNNADLIYNVILLVCNFSGRPSPNSPVYDLSRNLDVPTSPQGCPTINSTEDSDGLCNPIPPATDEIIQLKSEFSDVNKNCREENPPVLLLPIFTVENGYPPYRNLNMLKSRNNSQDSYLKEKFFSNISTDNTQQHDNMNDIVIHNRRKPINNGERYIENLREYAKNPNDNYNYNTTNSPQVLKKRPYMPLRTRKSNDDEYYETGLDRQLININEKCAHDQCNEMDVYTEKTFRDISLEYDDTGTYSKSHLNNNKQHKTEESDRKLMLLLDHLEEEVKYVNLDIEEKEMINLKIRMIYNIIGKNLHKQREEKKANSLTQYKYHPIHTSKPESQRKLGYRRSIPNRNTKYYNKKPNENSRRSQKSLKKTNHNYGPTKNQEYAYFGRNFYQYPIKSEITGPDPERRIHNKNRQNYLFSRPVKSEKRTNARRRRLKPKDGIYLPERTIHT